MEEVKVLGVWSSPYSNRVDLALHLKGIQYDSIEENLSNKSELLLKSNPVHKKIPVLIHNNKPISESLVILEYIDETWPGYPLLPATPHGKATARFWAKFVDEKIVGTSRKLRRAKEEEKGQIIEEVGELLKILEKELGEKEYFGGERIGYVDIVVFFTLYGFQLQEEVTRVGIISEDKIPVLWKWIGKLSEVEVVRRVLPPRDKHLAKVKYLLASPNYQ